MTLTDRIEKRLAAKGLKRAQASKLAGLNTTYIRDLIDGRVKNPRTEHLAKLAEVLDTTPEWLSEGRGPEEGGGELVQAAEVMNIWDRILPEDREHALRALKGFAHEEDAKKRRKAKE